MDTTTFIYIEDLRIRAFHGVLPQEHIDGNDYLINLRIGYPWMPAAINDNLNQTVSYADVVEIIKKQMSIESQLVETVANRIVKAIMAKYPSVTSISLRLTKLNPPMPCDCKGAGVEINITR